MLGSGGEISQEENDMGKTPVTPENATEVAGRFLRLYTEAISDILDKNG
jgi:hypothetical protein